LEDAYTGYGGVYNRTGAYGDADYDEPYYDAHVSVKGTAISGNLCDSQLAQSSEVQQQSSSLGTLQASIIAYAVSELHEGIRQTFSALVPRVTAIYPSVLSTYPCNAYLTQPSESMANEARLLIPSTYAEGSVNPQTTSVVMPPSGTEVSHEAVEQSYNSELEVNPHLTDANEHSCALTHQLPQPTPSTQVSQTFRRTRSYSW